MITPLVHCETRKIPTTEGGGGITFGFAFLGGGAPGGGPGCDGNGSSQLSVHQISVLTAGLTIFASFFNFAWSPFDIVERPFPAEANAPAAASIEGGDPPGGFNGGFGGLVFGAEGPPRALIGGGGGKGLPCLLISQTAIVYNIYSFLMK